MGYYVAPYGSVAQLVEHNGLLTQRCWFESNRYLQFEKLLKERVTWVEQNVDSLKKQLRVTKALVNPNPTQQCLEQNRVGNKEGLNVQQLSF